MLITKFWYWAWPFLFIDYDDGSLDLVCDVDLQKFGNKFVGVIVATCVLLSSDEAVEPLVPLSRRLF